MYVLFYWGREGWERRWGGMAGCWGLQRLYLQHHFWINEKQRTSNNFPSKACIVKGIVRGLNSVF